jgi:hypothetical protein
MAPVIPDQRPAQPTIILQQPGHVIPGGVPQIPRPEYHPGGPGPLPPTRVPTEEIAFIPPPPSRPSTGSPFPTLPVPTPMPTQMYPSSMGPNIVTHLESPPSSESPSTPSRRPRRRRRDSSPSYDLRSPTPSSRRDSRRPLTVTNRPEVPFSPGMQMMQPPIHVVSPSASPAPSLYAPMPGQQPQGQPTVIIQQPAQQAAPLILQYPPSGVTHFGIPPSMPAVPVPISDYSPPRSPVFPVVAPCQYNKSLLFPLPLLLSHTQ